MKMRKLNSKGFTIVELLIVIVIIGILATIGFVSFASAQNKAKKSKATATVAQVKSKLGEFFADNNSYPVDKPAVTAYLLANGGANTSTEFGTAAYDYTANPSACAVTTAPATSCSNFTLTAAASSWNGPATEDLSVTP